MAPTKKRQAKAATKAGSAKKTGRKGDDDYSENFGGKDESKIVEEGSHSEAGEENDEEDPMIENYNKYGFRNEVILDIAMPSGERELITDY